MKSGLSVGIVGASGAVGQEIIRLLEKRNHPVSNLKCFGSYKSQGSSAIFRGDKISIEILSISSFDHLDVVFFSAGAKVAKEFVNIARQKNVLVIDNSPAFREDPTVPLIIPEVNPTEIQNHDLLISNPNCAVILLLTALYPLHSIAKLKRLVISTYQAASGAGLKAMKELEAETLAFLQKRPHQNTVIPSPYAFNLFLHNSPIGPDLYAEEELKIIRETRKILADETLRIAVTCVRVPVLRAHAESVNAEFHHPLSSKEAYAALENAPGLQNADDFRNNKFAMPIDAAGQEDIFYSRIREDLSQANTLDMWIVGDQLLKGAALNAVQILEAVNKIKTNPAPTLASL